MSIIHLISSPRNVSTALMYAFAKRGDIQVIDEPFYAYYLNKWQVKSHPGFDEIIASQSNSSNQVIQAIETQVNQGTLFIKNMAQHIFDVDTTFLANHKVVFLIRDPNEQIFSFSKVITKPSIRDLGLKDQFDIFNKIEKQQNVIVVDSKILLLHPKAILQKLCNQLDIPFSNAMLHWEAGPIPEDGIWAKYWYKNVHQSTGLAAYQPKDITLDEHSSSIYHQVKDYYDFLLSFALQS